MIGNATFESLVPINENSFLFREFREVSFSAPYHFHPEIELTLILEGEGNRYVGSSHLSPYKAGDLVLLGPNLPHCWKSENIVVGKVNAVSLVFQFTKDFMGKDFFEKTEMTPINQLLMRSRHGIQFTGKTAVKIAGLVKSTEKENEPFKKLILLLQILNHLAKSNEYILLNNTLESSGYPTTDYKKINDVTAYIVDNFKKETILNEAAKIANMSVSAFCRYYKRITRTTFIESVIHYRINYAVQLLINTEKPIPNIGYESGFKDLSHFYRAFKKRKSISPLQYRKKFNSYQD
jgi:AraC-like DNA-binding protein